MSIVWLFGGMAVVSYFEFRSQREHAAWTVANPEAAKILADNAQFAADVAFAKALSAAPSNKLGAALVCGAVVAAGVHSAYPKHHFFEVSMTLGVLSAVIYVLKPI